MVRYNVFKNMYFVFRITIQDLKLQFSKINANFMTKSYEL